MSGLRVRLLVALGALLAAASARADDTHYQDFVLGGRALGMGGAFTAIADDPSGLFYNPAGIVDSHRSNLQVSTSLYGFERGSIDARVPLPVPGVEQLKFNFTDMIIIPASAGFVSAVGPADAEGVRRHAYGFSALVPSFRTTSAQSADAVRTYGRRVTDRELWAGAGYALRLRPDISIGAAVHYILRSVSDQEDMALVEPGNPRGPRFRTLTNTLEALSGSLVAILGIKWRVRPNWQLGASLHLPSLGVHSLARVQFAESSANLDAPQGPESRREDRTLMGKSRVRRAAVLRLGTSWQIPRRLTLSGDVSLHAPIRYSLLQVDGEGAAASLPFNPPVARRALANANLGVEVLLIDEVSVSIGGFTDFTTAPEIAAEPQSRQLPHINLYGLTTALGYFGEHTLTRIGMVYSFGSGQDVLTSATSPTAGALARSFARVRYFQSFFYIFASTSFRY